MSTRIQLRRDTAAAWSSVNPVLGAGEPALERDTGKLKIGDGTTAWSSLPYFLDLADLTPVIAAMVEESGGVTTEQVREVVEATVGTDAAFLSVPPLDVDGVLRLGPGAGFGAVVDGTVAALVADTESATSDALGAYATDAELAAGLATKVNSSTYTAGLATKQDAATLDAATAALVDGLGSTATALRAAFGRAAPVLSDFVYDAPTGNLLSYKEDGISIVLTYNSDGTVATSKRGTEPTQTFSYTGGNLVGVA